MPTANAEPTLAGLGVLVTRPRDQAEPLCRLLEAAGATPWRLPAMEIRPLASERPVFLQDYDLAIFISANAVRYGLPELQGQTRLAAVGAATGQALRQAGRGDILVPSNGFDSESLLAMPALRGLSGKRVLIVRGRGGREALAQGLRQRQAKVDYLEVYERAAARPDVEPVLRAWREGRLQRATVTSAELLENLAALLGATGMAHLRATPTVVFGPRLAQAARARGIEVVVQAPSNDDAGLMAGLAGIKPR